MTSTVIEPSRTRLQSGTIVIVATIVALSIVGAIGLWQGSSLGRDVAGIPWTVVSAGVWLVYGVLLLSLFNRPARRAQLLGFAVVLALAWGGLAATDFAARANEAAGQIFANTWATVDSSWADVFAAPIIEETLKMLGILLLVFLPAARRLGPSAGMAIGAFVAASFQVVENEVYTLKGMFDAPDALFAALIETFFIRGVVGVFSHVVYSAAIGAAIGWLIAGPRDQRLRRLAATIGVFLLMVVLHSWSNWTAHEEEPIMYIVTMAVGLIVLVVTFRFARSQEPTADVIPET